MTYKNRTLQDTWGARVPSRTNRALHPETPTRQALFDEHRNATAKLIPGMMSNGTLVKKTCDKSLCL